MERAEKSALFYFKMNYIFIFGILIVGASGIVAQVLLLRELLVSFYGNELILGIILANWLIAEALGAFLLGKFVERVKNKFNAFVILEIIFSLFLPLSIYFSRVFKNFLGITFGEALSLGTIFYVSFFIILPVGFCHGGLFSVSSKIYRSIGKVYSLEIIGTIIGGLVLTYIFIPFFSSFQIAFFVSLANLILCIFFLKEISKVLKYVSLLLFVTFGYLSFSGDADYLNRFAIERQWKAQEVLDYQNSVYGNIVVTKKEKQYTFFYNGIPIITTPYPDIAFVEEFGNLPLLFHRFPRDILIISGGCGGLINEVLKHPVERVDYAELDPMIIRMLRKYPTNLTSRELSDKRVKIINLDGRFFLRTTHNKYDAVLIGISHPADLSTNRLFTEEFFFMVREKLNPGGLLAFWLPGSLTYLSQELRDLNFCILNGLKQVYNYVRVIPGDYNLILASGSDEILKVTPGLITRRINQQKIKVPLLLPSYLDYRLNQYWVDWFKRSTAGAILKSNKDDKPIAVFQMLVFLNKQFYPGLTRIFRALQDLNLRQIFAGIFLLTLFLNLYFYRRRQKLAKFSLAYSIATTGFFGMSVNLILIFSFQTFYGYLYYAIGILMSVFMAGCALGSILLTSFKERLKNNLRLFIRLEILIILFSCLLAWLIPHLIEIKHYVTLVFIVLFFLGGFLVGMEFPLASKIYLNKDARIGQTAGVLYFSDLLGGWCAGMLGGVLLLPILGLSNTCMAVVLLKLSSLSFVLAGKKELG